MASKAWTKEKLEKLIKNWDSMDRAELAKLLGVNNTDIGNMVNNLKKSGIKLTDKRVDRKGKGYVQQLIKSLKK